MKNREYRNMTDEVRKDGDKPSFLVEGYATTFEPYKLIEIDGEDYNEKIEPTAFDEADMSDVVYRIDHEGKVFARSSAGTIKLDIDEHGNSTILDDMSNGSWESCSNSDYLITLLDSTVAQLMRSKRVECQKIGTGT